MDRKEGRGEETKGKGEDGRSPGRGRKSIRKRKRTQNPGSTEVGGGRQKWPLMDPVFPTAFSTF